MSQPREVADLTELNNALLKTSGYAAQQNNADILAVTPYSKGYGFSVKKTYPDYIREAFPVENKDKIFAFISLAAYRPNNGSKSGLGLAFLEITAAKSPERYGSDGSVVPLHDDGKNLPMSLTDTYHFDFDTNLLYATEDKTGRSMSLEAAFQNLWNEHLATFSKVNRPWLQAQMWFRSKLQGRFIFFIAVTEILTWIISGQTFNAQLPITPDKDDSDELFPDDNEIQKKKEWIFRWLMRLNPYRRPYKSDIFAKIDIDYSSSKVTFHGISVTPIAVFWFYVIVLGFFGYRNLEFPVGEMEFLNAYWYAILFFAPITVLILSNLLPALAKVIINWLVERNRKIEVGLLSRVSLKRRFGLMFFVKKSKFEFDENNYTW